VTSRKAILIGPFSRGVNTYDDPTALHDKECAEALNFDPGLDGSLRSRPPFTDTGKPLPVSGIGNPQMLGYFYDTDGSPYLLASDGDSSTWAYYQGSWTLVTSALSATDMTQFDGKAWLVSPVGEADPGGYWTPSGGFVADADMPRGASITSYKSRLWIAQGIGGDNPTRIYYSKVIGQPDFWKTPAFLDVGSGDGQNVVKILAYYDTMLVFRTKSIWSFQYSQDPASATQGVIVPGVGLQSRHALVTYENYLYFMYDENAYRFVNNRAEQINTKVPFRTLNPGSTDNPFTVSLFNNRVLYSYYEMIYVYSLRTQTWTTWRSDTWGPIGQLMMPFTDDQTGVAYALPSASVTPRATIARNRSWNPSFKKDLRNWSASSGAKDLTRVTDIPGSAHCASFVMTATGGQIRQDNMAINVGEKAYISMRLRLASGTATGAVRMHFVTGGTEGLSDGDISSPYDSAPVSLSSSEWTEVTFETPIAAEPGVNFIRVYPRIENATVDQVVYLDDVIWDTKPLEIEGYFDGDTVSADPDISYGWDNEDGNSPSRKFTFRGISLLKIEDRVSDASEDMLCVLVTKNYNFDVPGSFKVLFWWGIDAIFKTNIRGQVIPGVYNLSSTWGKLLAEGASWGRLLSGTWTHPYLSDPSVVSDVSTGPGPSRKFVKFFKKLRFRQLQFRITFQTDGSSSTAPVQIFTLSTYMTEKQTVSKTVS